MSSGMSDGHVADPKGCRATSQPLGFGREDRQLGPGCPEAFLVHAVSKPHLVAGRIAISFGYTAKTVRALCLEFVGVRFSRRP